MSHKTVLAEGIFLSKPTPLFLDKINMLSFLGLELFIRHFNIV